MMRRGPIPCRLALRGLALRGLSLSRGAWLAAWLAAGAACAAPGAPPAAAGAACPWPAWEAFRSHFVSAEGRVIDPAEGSRYSTSEGQSYGLFFALAGNDRASFERILRWTEDNLADGDLTARLPAWQWGRRDDASWGVTDRNAASDADLWIAYALGEAGRLWRAPQYSALGQLVAERIVREETAVLPGLGRAMLPGPQGFQPGPGLYRLNPSYLPLQLLRRMAALYPQSEWKHMPSAAADIVLRSAPKGYAPDWILYRQGSGFQADPETRAVGSYNAIRVYLWAGMLADDEALRAVLLKTFAPMARQVAAEGTPPLESATREGTASGVGSVGFSAALLPFLAASGQRPALQQQRLRLEAKAPLTRADNYYDQALTLFGAGWHEGRFRFARDGGLLPQWTCASN